MPDRRVAWFHCFSGVAGDMALGALIDAGADPDEVSAIVARLGIDGWRIDAEPVLRAGVAATRVHVHAPDDDEAQDALQDAYLNAFRHIGTFRGEAQMTTWLTRIVLNECHRRLRSRRPPSPTSRPCWCPTSQPSPPG